MPLDRETTARLEHLANRVTNGAARGVVHLVDDSGNMQIVQIGVLDGEALDGAEHFQPYGFSSVPPPADADGAPECAVMFPGGDRGHPIVLAVADRRHRRTGAPAGDVAMRHFTGAIVTFTEDGDVVLRPAPGRQVLVDDGSGAAALPTMADFNGIVSIMNSAGAGAATNLPAAVTAYQTAHPTWPDGTKVIKGK